MTRSEALAEHITRGLAAADGDVWQDISPERRNILRNSYRPQTAAVLAELFATNVRDLTAALGNDSAAHVIAHGLATYEFDVASLRLATDAELLRVPGLGPTSLEHIRQHIPAPLAPSTGAAEPTPLTPGDIVHGFAYGAFGRDHADCVRVEVRGPDWIVARSPDSPGPCFTAGSHALELCQKARDEPCRNTPCPFTSHPEQTR